MKNVILHHNDEAGARFYSICKEEDFTDWIQSFTKRRESEAYCKKHKLKIIKFICTITDCKLVHKR